MDSQSKFAQNPQPDHNRFIATGECSSGTTAMVRFWPIAAVSPASRHFGNQAKSGQHLVAMSLSHFDPQETLVERCVRAQQLAIPPSERTLVPVAS
jgi:hypothetical protein